MVRTGRAYLPNNGQWGIGRTLCRLESVPDRAPLGPILRPATGRATPTYGACLFGDDFQSRRSSPISFLVPHPQVGAATDLAGFLGGGFQEGSQPHGKQTFLLVQTERSVRCLLFWEIANRVIRYIKIIRRKQLKSKYFSSLLLDFFGTLYFRERLLSVIAKTQCLPVNPSLIDAYITAPRRWNPCLRWACRRRGFRSVWPCRSRS